jgi:large subunit ribosomal protein L13
LRSRGQDGDARSRSAILARRRPGRQRAAVPSGRRKSRLAMPGPGRYHPASFVPQSQREAKFREASATEAPGISPTRHRPDLPPLTEFPYMKTFSAKSETVQRDWYLVDASGKTLGRLATELAHRLRGKHKPVYTPHVDTGDYLIVINAEKIHVTGNKLADKKYHRFTGYIGNLKTETLGQALERHPERVIETAVKGMLPKNPLGRAMYRKLKVYKGAEHPHAAQQPQVLDI